MIGAKILSGLVSRVSGKKVEFFHLGKGMYIGSVPVLASPVSFSIVTLSAVAHNERKLSKTRKLEAMGVQGHSEAHASRIRLK